VDLHSRPACSVLGAVALAGALALPAAANADATRCRERVALESARFAQTVMKALSGCEEFVIKGKSAGPCPDETATARIAKAESQLRVRIDKTCGGTDRTCGGFEDTPLALYGWDVGACPDIEGAGCANAVDDCIDVAECLRCVGDVATNQLVGLYADDFEPSLDDATLNSCQVRISKETLRLFRSRSKLLQKCWRGVSRERFPGPCPDPGDGKVLVKVAAAEAKMVSNICKVCGGGDRECGTPDDLGVAAIGFAAACPDVTTPEGQACGGPITTLDDVVDCIACVAEFKGDCLDALAVPWATSYPTQCSP
jgi:hypothetical protein